MINTLDRIIFRKKSKFKLTIILLLIFGFIMSSTVLFHNKSYQNQNTIDVEENEIKKSSLFQGAENPLNLTDYGVLNEYNEGVSVTNQEELNLTFYLDDIHNWKSSRIEHNISNIQDTRNWINNSGFERVDIFRKYQTFESDHPYRSNRSPGDRVNTIFESGATYIRAHFVNSSFERYYDFLYVYDDSFNEEYLVLDGNRTNFYSPWIPGDTIEVTYDSDFSNQWDGYTIDYYEFVNSSSNFDINSDSWSFNSQEIVNGKNCHGSGEIGGEDAMWVGLYPELVYSEEYDYDEGAFSEVYQNISIPRGQVHDAYLSFDYYVQNGLDTNENYIYFQVNKQKVYSRGMGDAVDGGRNNWQSTGKIFMDLWVNTSTIFEPIISAQEINISVGIMSGEDVTYSYYHDGFQNIIWFDNISLVLTTTANSSQSDIEIEFNGLTLIERSNWGTSTLNISSTWDTDPVIITVSTLSPSLTFDLDTKLFGYHSATSKINQLNDEGITYEIIDNGTIYWEFFHNLYMPTHYSDFEFILDKPKNWEIISVLDPTLISVPFEGGNSGDDFMKINKTNALYSGWWKIRAASPNYIDILNTFVNKPEQIGATEFYSGETAIIKTQINHSGEVPLNLGLTSVEIVIFSPNGSIWHQETKKPSPNGTVLFSEVLFSSFNTTGGIYNFTLLWSNGTSLGAVKLNFTVIHDSYIKLLKPDDAVDDNKTGGAVGEIFPLRIYLRDYENNQSISDAIVSYNWTTGTVYLNEVVSGIYEAVLDTSDLGSLGSYEIDISADKIGFSNSKLILTINLGEETKLQRLESDSQIEINKNSTIEFKYYSDVDLEGISGAQITVNISNPSYYSIEHLLNGIYRIEFSTIFIGDYGIYQLVFTFEADGFEAQEYIYQFEIIRPPQPTNQENYLLIILLIVAIILGGVFAALSLRSYVFLPRKRKKESELLARTQRFKDLSNIQAVVVIHRLSGIPIYSHSYSILEKHKKELFSGFIQAITTIGEEIVGRDEINKKTEHSKSAKATENILELDFKYFYCLICDRGELRIVFVLKEKGSDRLKEEISNLSLSLVLQLSEQIENWDGSLDIFEVKVPPIIKDYIELHYKEPFEINNAGIIAKAKKDNEITSMETRVLNVIYSMAKGKRNFYIEQILDIIHEENKDLVIDAIETLIYKKVIIPSIK